MMHAKNLSIILRKFNAAIIIDGGKIFETGTCKFIFILNNM